VTPSPLPVDSLDVWGATASLPEQVAEAAEQAREAVAGMEVGECTDAVVLGTGTAGLAGDLLAALAAGAAPVPVGVVKGFDLPVHVGPGTLVFAVSASGDDAETVSSAAAAYDRGARVLTVAGGGELGRLAEARGGWLLHVPPVRPVRAALGWLTVPVLVAAGELGLLADVPGHLEDARHQLRRRRDQLVGDDSPAAASARRIGRTMLLVHGAQPVAAVAARRWKSQVNENAKAPAFASSQPELSHDEVSGWGQFGDVTRQVFTLVLLRTEDEHPAVARRITAVAELMDEVVAATIEVRAEGRGDLARFFDLALVGDFVSLHLAGRDGVDPGPVPSIDDVARQAASP